MARSTSGMREGFANKANKPSLPKAAPKIFPKS